jgi:hypothetical protein
LDLGLSTSNPKLVSSLTVYLFFPSHWPKLIFLRSKGQAITFLISKRVYDDIWDDIWLWCSDVCPTLEYTHATHYQIHI